ncbi:YfbU family protein [Sinorhizobium americanum]|uniref:YfbU family protein n=1 Tax=Sinorhizobium americanum TaxID=194963 RepID=UPI0007D9F7D5|nr:YfbU family protein [Sinorhizobium americanum]OAP43715.1 hypothetical protein ATC00_02415 [Sinorhizobium americanum]
MALAAEKDGKEELDLGFIRSAILSGNTWALTWQFPGIPTDDTDPRIADETAEILGMWSYIEHSVRQLSPADKAQLEKDAYPFDLEFSGFDGNHDEHHGVASFMINELGRFSEFRGRQLNSHTQSSLPSYRRMLLIYNEEVRSRGLTAGSLSAESILKIVKPA